MESTALILITLFFSSLPTPVLSSDPCRPDSCDELLGPEVRFPFRLVGRQRSRCGYPGFSLRCNAENQTVIELPESGAFVVDHIDYTAQAVFINDPDFCLPRRLLNLSLAGTPFRGAYSRNLTFLNCTSDYMEYSRNQFTPLFCLGGRNYTVLSTSSAESVQVPATCRLIRSVVEPLGWRLPEFYWSSMDLMEDLELVWREPSCVGCESHGGRCGYKGDPDSDPEISCFMPSKRGLPRGAKYGIIIGVGVPGLVCIIGLAFYAFGLLRAFTIRQRGLISPDLPITIFSDRPTIRSASGLDRPTIESYPITVLGESLRFPKSSEVSCPICLSDYEPNETLRSIPECNHYFHADCIDEWLKLNGTCPLCRNSPEDSIGTLCFLESMSSSSTGLALDQR